MSEEEKIFSLDVQGIRAAKGDKVLLDPNHAALHIVVDICEPGKHTVLTKHLKPTRKALNGYHHPLRLTADAGSPLHATLLAAVRGGGAPSTVTFAVKVLDLEQVKQLPRLRTQLPSRPEFVFTAGSQVLCVASLAFSIIRRKFDNHRQNKPSQVPFKLELWLPNSILSVSPSKKPLQI